jgi:hypothetical protein
VFDFPEKSIESPLPFQDDPLALIDLIESLPSRPPQRSHLEGMSWHPARSVKSVGAVAVGRRRHCVHPALELRGIKVMEVLITLKERRQ